MVWIFQTTCENTIDLFSLPYSLLFNIAIRTMYHIKIIVKSLIFTKFDTNLIQINHNKHFTFHLNTLHLNLKKMIGSIRVSRAWNQTHSFNTTCTQRCHQSHSLPCSCRVTCVHYRHRLINPTYVVLTASHWCTAYANKITARCRIMKNWNTNHLEITNALGMPDDNTVDVWL